MKGTKLIYLMVLGGAGSVLLGLPYILEVFGPTESIVALWGQVSVFLGVLLVFSAITLHRVDIRIKRLILASEFSILALLQIPPTFFWIESHGHGISDLPYPDQFIAHWGYSIPHMILFLDAIFILVVYGLSREARKSQ